MSFIKWGYEDTELYDMYYFFNYAFVVYLAKLMLGRASRIINN